MDMLSEEDESWLQEAEKLIFDGAKTVRA